MTGERDKARIPDPESGRSDQPAAVRNDRRVYTLDDLPPHLVTAILNAEVPDDLEDTPDSRSECTEFDGESDTFDKERG